LIHQAKDITAVLLSKEKQYFFLLIAGEVFINLLDIAAIALLYVIINFYTQPLATLPSFLTACFPNTGSLLPIGIFLLFFCIKNAAGYLVSRAQYNFVYAVAARLSQKKLLQYLEGSYHNYVAVDSSVHIKSISQQPIEFGQYVLLGMQQIIAQLVLITITVIAMFFFNAKLFLLLFIMLLPPVILIAYLIKRKTGEAKKHIKESSEGSLQYLKETISGFIESRIYDSNDFFTQRYADKQKKLSRYLGGIHAVQAMPGRMIEVFAVFGFFILIVVSHLTSGQATPSVITIGAFMAAAYKIIPGMIKILNSSGMMKTYEYTISNVSANTVAAINNTSLPAPVEIAFKNVSFCYAEKIILDNFSCRFNKREFIGISGLSGKGKTTLINLLLGFEEPVSGEIYFDDRITDAALRQQYRNHVAYVKQQAFLIHDSFLANITLSDTNIDDKKLAAAIAASGLNDILIQYPKGIHTIIAENGKNISGGQRQRIVIARALYKNAGIIILDEPFNELDQASENKLLDHFKKEAAAGKIIILITHNSSSLSQCSKIISLDEN